MKIFTRKERTNLYKLSVAALFSISTLLSSCSTKETPVPESASLMVVNTSPSPATFNAYVNGGKISSSGALAFGGAIAYLRLNTGENTVKFTTASSTESLISKKITLENKKIYSLFLIDKDPKLDFLISNDDVATPPTTKALIRFINLSPDAPALDLAIKDGAALVTDKTYKAVSAFIEIEPKKYIFQIKDKTASPLQAEMAETEIKAGGIYTLLSIGLVNPTGLDPKITAKLITNK